MRSEHGKPLGIRWVTRLGYARVWVFMGLVTLAGCGVETASESGKPKLVIVAFDGLEPSLLDELLAAQRLPNFRRLIDNGSRAAIDCVVGTTSPVVWTTVATGVPPERHGITGFTVDDVPVTSTLRRVPAFWNLLPRFDISAATIGWMVSWPAEPGSGIVISDRSHWGHFEDKVSPPEIIDPAKYLYNGIPDTQFLPRFTSYPYDPDYASLPKDDPRYAANFLLKLRLIDIYVRDETYSDITGKMLRRQPLDVLAVYFQGADYVSHGFWQYLEPQPFRDAGWTVDEEEIEHLKDVIPRYYAYLDGLLGSIMEQVGDQALYVVLSDHGFGPGLGAYRTEAGDFLSGNHRPTAELILSGPPIKKNVAQWQKITHFDVLPTLLYALDVPLARDQAGRPLLRYFSDEYLKKHQVSYVESHDQDSRTRHEAVETDEDKKILDELKSLGYIE